MGKIEQIRANALAVLRPPPDMPLANWVEENVFLPSTASATPGRMKLYSYQRGICDALDDPNVSEIVIQKSARIGFTALLSGYIGHCVAVNPAPLLVTQPTSDDSRAFSVDTEALFEASPTLRGLISDDADESGRSTMMRRIYPGGTLEFLSASSPRAFRRKLGKVAIADEIDAYPPTDEGSVLDLLKMRTQTYRDRKLIFGGTPIFDFGPVTTLYSNSDQRVFEVRCVECDGFAEILWKDIRFDPENLAKGVEWCCPCCGCLVPEKHKVEMVANGRWRATRPEVKTRAGFRINSLVSPHFNARWSALAAEFLEAKKTPEGLQSFVNLVLGEPWKTEGEDLDEHELTGRREHFSLEVFPSDVLLLTVGVDVQDDRLECVVMGHSATEIFVFNHRVFYGPVDGDAVWLELDDLLRERWQHANGGTIGIDACAVDSGDGGHTDIVHGFTRSRFGRRVVSTKGVPGFSRQFLAKSKTRGQQVWLVGVDAVKAQLFNRIQRKEGVRFSQDLEPIFFEQLTSERRVMRYVRGVPQPRFERVKGKRAETLDATVYAWAARSLINLNLDRRAEELSSQALVKKPERVIRSSWLGR
ncbi:phage terminase large subunit family protein [Martelella radicis]|uniref:Phage terminase large subunit GpA-like protein n=1 Tax=Martelella radicis TaxID=1397476 RepID=A0A7W6KFB7_9HYPH|nr:terminase gpA endonuclease subunit [Martelella radicis]MBB4120216.1 phage terminase large subunit GpA-like protein [Martelella radicis]